MREKRRGYAVPGCLEDHATLARRGSTGTRNEDGAGRARRLSIHSRAMTRLDRETIVEALKRLNYYLEARGERADLFLVGGAVMCLVHQARPATKDVDAWFSNPQAVRIAAQAVANELGLPEDWLNDAAKAYVPLDAGYETWQELSHLTISTVDTRTLLAMKCAAARTAEDGGDIRFLANLLGLRSSRDVLGIVVQYFPADRLPVRARLLLEEMFDDRG